MINITEQANAPDLGGVRAQVLAAGREEFARQGLEGASVRAIGKRAGVTAAMVNYYFGGKRGLYDAVVAEAQGRLSERLTAAVVSGERAHLAARLAGAYFDFLAEDQQLQRLLLRQVLDQGDATRALAEQYVRPLRALFDRHFGPDDEALHRAVSLFGAIAGYFLYEPVLGAFLGEDPLAPEALHRRRQHVLRLATQFEETSR